MIKIPESFPSRKVQWIGLILAAMFLFGWFTWPLPRYVTRGIVSSHRPEVGAPRYAIPGDHLQLMYYFDLMKGFLTGQTPWFHNLYEFNVGDDAATRNYDMYYAPFSWVYTIGALGGNHSFGWNLASFISILFSILGTWLLVRRFPAPLSVQWAATAVGVGLPYRWITLLHGSPTGFAMVYVPWILYGLHLAIEGRQRRGGWIAGSCLLMSAWGDIHTFFFMSLLSPFWGLFVFYLQKTPRWSFQEIKNLLIALQGFIALGFVVLLQALMIRLHLNDGMMAGGRSLEEVILFSPRPGGLISLDPDHTFNHLYLPFSGLSILALILFFSFKQSTLRSARDAKKALWLQGLFLTTLIGIILLALGPRLIDRLSPFYWRVLTKLIPPYAMIRQTTKIYAILPSLMAVFVVLPYVFYKQTMFSNQKLNLALLGLGTLFLVESQSRMDPTINLIDRGSPAYRAIREDAESRGEIPRALGIVLWPGDSHWTSVKQYYAMMDRIRLVNGYRPNVPIGYFEEIFLRFKPLNKGYASDEILNDLLERGIRYLILHEDLFPEQVSPFGVSYTLSGLLAHPRIRVLKQHQSVWAFEIMREASVTNTIITDWDKVSSARLWHLIRYAEEESPLAVKDSDAFRGTLIRLHPEGRVFSFPIDAMGYSPSLRLQIRARGHGILNTSFRFGDTETPIRHKAIAADDWTWIEIPIPPFEGFEYRITSHLSASEGTVDLDLGTLLSGPSTLDLAPGESITFPAPTLFRAGFTDLDQNEVIFLPELAPHGEVFYGPRRVFPAGRYRITLRYRAESYPGIVGHFRVREPISAQTDAIHLSGSEHEATLEADIRGTLPLVVAFTYLRTDPVHIHSLEIYRIK